jgi:hypothetical protein
MFDRDARERTQALEAQGVQSEREIADRSGPPPTSAVSSAAASQSPASASTSGPAVALPPPPAGIASLIVADFQAPLAEFRGKRFTLLWRGSRDGFLAKDFHGRCDGHANTLTLIEDTGGNIFGGFTPVEWESREDNMRASKALGRSNCFKADPSLKSFIFTLQNSHNFAAKKFVLNAERKGEAVCCRSTFLTLSQFFTVKEIAVFEIAD